MTSLKNMLERAAASGDPKDSGVQSFTPIADRGTRYDRSILCHTAAAAAGPAALGPDPSGPEPEPTAVVTSTGGKSRDQSSLGTVSRARGGILDGNMRSTSSSSLSLLSSSSIVRPSALLLLATPLSCFLPESSALLVVDVVVAAVAVVFAVVVVPATGSSLSSSARRPNSVGTNGFAPGRKNGGDPSSCAGRVSSFRRSSSGRASTLIR